MQVYQQGIRLLTFFIPWYSLLIVLAAWIGIEIVSRLGKSEGRDPEHVWRAMVWILPLAMIGARLWFILFPPDSVVATGRTTAWFLRNFLDVNQGAIAVWTGGLGIFGAILGGLLGLLIYARRNAQPIRPWLDLGVIGLSLAQVIGRIANGVNGEHYGAPTNLPWGIRIDNADHRVAPYTDLARYPLASTYFHPVWAYEAILIVVIFVALLILRNRQSERRTLRPGDLALIYGVFYGAGRFFLEFMRINISHVGAVNATQAAALLLAIGCGAILWRGR